MTAAPMDSRVSFGPGSFAGTRLIAGSGRSGTTWLQDSLAAANGLRPVFEPLHPRVSPIGAEYAHRVIRADESHPELVQFLEDVIAGKRERFWTQYRCQRSFIVPGIDDLRSYAAVRALAHRWGKFLFEAPGFARVSFRHEPIIKCIWSNLMLGWLSRRCGFRVVLLVRHPGAVVESERRNFWSARATLDRLRRDQGLHELTGGRYQRLLERRLAAIEEFAALWVIENQWILENAGQCGVTVVFYEHLRSLVAAEWQRACDALSLSHLPKPAHLVRPSQQAAPQESGGDGGSAALAKWQRALTEVEKGQIQDILHDANFAQYSMSDAMPQFCAGDTGVPLDRLAAS
jgi:hypothetical protein